MVEPLKDSLEKQLSNYQSYLKSDPTNIQLIIQTAQLLNRLGRFDQSLALIDEGLQFSPEDPGLIFTKATVAMSAQRPQDAIDLLQSLMLKGVDNGAVRYNLAYSFALLNDMKQAHQVLEPALANATTDTPEVYVLLARIKHYLGEIDEAIELIEAFLHQFPDHPQSSEAEGVIALLLLDSQEMDSAREHARKSLEVDNNNSDALITMGTLALDELEAEQALADFNQVVSRYPNNGRAWLGIGLTEMLNNDLPAAEEALHKGLNYLPNHTGSLVTLAWCQIAQNKLDDAKATLFKAMDIDRNFSEIHGSLAVVYLQQNDRAQAQKYIDRALGLDKMSFSGNYAQSIIDANAGREVIAKKTFAKLLNAPLGKGRKTINSELQKYANRRNKH